MKPGTWTEAQYSTPSARAMIRGWLRADLASVMPSDVERVALYMSRTLRIGPLRVCSAMVLAAVAEPI